MPFRLPRLRSTDLVVTASGQPTSAYQQWWQQVVERIEFAIKTIVDLTGIQEQFELALAQQQQATKAAQDAADAAAAAALAAQRQADDQKREAALQTSYIDPSSVLTASPTTVTVAAHTRYYGDGTSVSVANGTVAASAPGDTDYVFYADPMRTGGNVTYQVDTVQPVQGGDIHVVGAVTIPTTGTADGGEGPSPPGKVVPRQETST